MSGERQVKVLYDERTIAQRTEELAREIAATKPKDLLVVAILKGSFMFAADLLRALHRVGLEPQVEFFHLSSYVTGTVSSGTVKILRDIESSVRDRDVLLVDDILESGRTLAFAKDLLAARGAGGFSSARCWRSPASGSSKLAPTSSASPAPTFLSLDTAWTSPIAIENCRLLAASSLRRTPARSKRQFRKRLRVLESRFQSFVALGDPSHGRARVDQLRAELTKQGLAGFIVPRADEHQNEYVPANAERLRWLTGFAGSAGLVVVLKDSAALFVDGRYTEQVKSEADASVFEFRRVPEDPPGEWIAGQLKQGDKLGYDPRLHTPDAVARYTAACEKAGASLVAVHSNPVDAIWPDRPPAPLGAITPHKLRFAGEGAPKKIVRVRQALGSSHGLLISDPHNLAWLFNIRGSDVSYTPLPIGWAYLPLEGRPVVFLDGRKLSPASRQSLGRHADVLEPDALLAFVEDLGRQGVRIAFDTATVPAYLTQAIERAGGKADIGADPITLMKAKKNPFELAGARAAHERDGAAIANFLAWFATEAPRGRLTEIDAVKALETFRRASPALKDLSFPTIAGAGPNSAIPHYRVSEESNRKIERGIFLIDSGAQYEDGTTDITRTIAVGRPSALMRDRFTRVLKGHIAVTRAVFPPERTAPKSMRWRAPRFGERALISIMARDMASGRISRSTKVPSASPRPERPPSRRG